MSGKTAVVTGGARRIGRAIAVQLHEDGFNVLIHYQNSETDAKALVEELNKKRPNSANLFKVKFADSSVANSSDASETKSLPERCEALIDYCFSCFGSCDVLVNNASAYYSTPLLAQSSAADGAQETTSPVTEVAEIFGSNALAPFYLTQVFARRFTNKEENKERNRCIINMVDSMAAQPLLGFTMYTMAKHALEGLTKSAALELSGIYIRVNGVAPGLCVLPVDMSEEDKVVYRTKVPLGQREASAEEVASAVSFLVSDKAVYITGSNISVDGGWSLTRQ